MSVVNINNSVKKFWELIIRLMTSSVNANTGVNIFATGENSLLESIIAFVLLEFILVPNISRKQLAEERFGSRWENWEASQISCILKVRTDHHVISWRVCSSLRHLELCLCSIHCLHFWLISPEWLIRHLLESSWIWLLMLGTALWSLHTALPSRTRSLSLTLLDLRRNIATALYRRVSGQIHGAVPALSLFLYNCSAFVSN